MNKPSSSGLSLKFKLIMALLLIINGAIFVTGYLARQELETSIIAEKSQKLLALAQVLNAHLDEGGYDAILEMRGARRTPKADQIHVLNEELAPFTDKIAETLSGVGLGYYSRDLDAILTYGPSREFGYSVGKPIDDEHPGRSVMRNNEVMVRSGKMVRGEIMNVMLPIERKGRVIGYIWSNELLSDIREQMSAITMRFGVIMLICSLVTIALVLLLSRKAMLDVDKIIKGVHTMRKNLLTRIDVRGGELGELANNINALAEDVGRASGETNRAIKALDNVMNNLSGMVYVTDFTDMRIVYANRYLCELTGRESLAGEKCHKVIFGLDTPCPTCPKSKLFDPKGQPIMTPVHFEAHNEHFGRDFAVMGRLLHWHDDRLVGLVHASDITDRTLLAAANASSQAQRDFLARMSHEIRTPMNGVLGMVRLALNAKTSDEQTAYIRKIQSSATILLGIINGILDFSRLEAGKMTLENAPFDLRQAVDDVCELVLPNIQEKGLEMRVEVANGVPQYVKGDKLRLTQVILNLMGNAAKFTLKGHVDLKLYAHEQADGSLLLDCTVADTGIGMDEEQQLTIFTPFKQADSSTSRKFGGSGLGLSIVKSLVNLMGGEISVHSEPGWGSEFNFYVKLEKAEAPAGEVATTAADGGEGKLRCAGRSFLVVEDNVINQEIAVAVLSEMGAEVDVANNGQEGLDAFLAKDYDTIFMDLRMPVMDGLEATRKIRTSGKHDARTVYIIAMTANVMQEDKDASIRAGMNGHVGKPLDMDELLPHLH